MDLHYIKEVLGLQNLIVLDKNFLQGKESSFVERENKKHSQTKKEAAFFTKDSVLVYKRGSFKGQMALYDDGTNF